MLTIGDVAQRTGVSRRMLRHWEAEGLLTPADVDEATGYRRYVDSQVGRVHAIAALRSLGFGLGAIADLLDPALTTPRLLEVLKGREHELAEQIDADQRSLGEVRRRLRAIQEGLQMTAQTLQLQPLPALRLAHLSTEVRDETEIGHAVVALDARVRTHLADDGRPWDGTVVRVYDAAPQGGPIRVTVGVQLGPDGDSPAGLQVIDLQPEPRGVSITYDDSVESEADAWMALDAALEPYGLVTTSRYHAVVSTTGVTLLAAVLPVGDRDRSAGAPPAR